MDTLPNMTPITAPSKPVKKVLQQIDALIEYRRICSCGLPYERVFAEHFDTLNKALKTMTGGRQSLETHGYSGKQILCGQSLKKRKARNPKLAL